MNNSVVFNPTGLKQPLFSTQPIPASKEVLIIDDNSDILLLIKHNLEKDGYRVTISENSLPIYQFEGNYPDLILVDLVLDEDDGKDICHFLKHNPLTAHIPVILYSGQAMEKMEDSNADCLMSKPFKMQDLKTNIKLFLSHVPLKNVS